jgi:uncharacterized protein DUF1592/uncharacterized protein DUF1588
MSAHPGSSVSNVLDTYCSGCHNGRMRSPSGPLLERFDATQIPASPELWARAYRQLQAGTMPPVGSPRPDRTTSSNVLISIEQALGASGAKMPAAASSREIAVRLAALLWNSGPDASLLQDAEHGRLSDPNTLERQIHRMLADDRTQAFISRFFFPWLQLDTLGNSDPDKKYFPDYDVSLRDALIKETELFLLSQLRDDRDPVELWSADYTFLNAQLAEHYGVPNVTGPQFRRVPSTPERAGLLGHGSILMVTSRHQHGVDAAYTTPATRAKWVRLHFLGAPLPNGFPGAQPVKPELPITPQTRTLPAEPCVNCHRNFFPLGYALENFDPLGRWRTHDQAGPVDVSGTFVDGTSTNGVVELRRLLLQYSEAFRTTIAEQLLVYSSAGSVARSGGTPETLIRARQILHSTPAPRWSALLAAIVQTKPVGEP